MNKGKTHYETMGLQADASPEQVKKRFRELALKYHPDRHPERPEMHEIFLHIREAYEVLNDPGRRASYDLNLRDRARKEQERAAPNFGSAPTGPRSGARQSPPGPMRGAPGAAMNARERREAEQRKQAVSRMMDDARLAFTRGNLREAQRLCDEVLRMARVGAAYEMLGDIYSRQGKVEQAIHNFTLAAQLQPNNSLVMAKLNRLLSRGGGGIAGREEVIPSRRMVGRPVRPAARLSWQATITCLGLSGIILLVTWAQHLDTSKLLWPLVPDWTGGHLVAMLAAGFLSGIVLATAAWVRPIHTEFLLPVAGTERRALPVALIIGPLGLVSPLLAFLVYLFVAFHQETVSVSILGAFASTFALLIGFLLNAPPGASMQTLMLGGNILFVTLLFGWMIGDVLRPTWMG